MNLRRLLQPKCRRCSKHRPIEEFVAGGPVTGYCLRCLEHHNEALELLCNGSLPRGCHECGLSIADLMARTSEADMPLYVHPKDGIYQLLCATCSDSYEQKRADLYRHTPHGVSKGL